MPKYIINSELKDGKEITALISSRGELLQEIFDDEDECEKLFLKYPLAKSFTVPLPIYTSFLKDYLVDYEWNHSGRPAPSNYFSPDELFVDKDNNALIINYHAETFVLRKIEQKYHNRFTEVDSKMLNSLINAFKDAKFIQEKEFNDSIFITKEEMLKAIDNNSTIENITERIIEQYDYLDESTFVRKVKQYLNEEISEEEMISYLYLLLMSINTDDYEEVFEKNIAFEISDILDGMSFGLDYCEEDNRNISTEFSQLKSLISLLHNKKYPKEDIERYCDIVDYATNYYRIGILNHKTKRYFLFYVRNPDLNIDNDYKIANKRIYEDEAYIEKRYYSDDDIEMYTGESEFFELFSDYIVDKDYKIDESLIELL